MEIYIYNTDLTLIGVIDEIASLIWTRRYWSSGEFKLLVPFTATNVRLLTVGNLILKQGDKEAAQISYVSIQKDAFGLEVIEVQGKFTSYWLDRRIIFNQIIATANSQDILYSIVAENITEAVDKRKIPLLEIEPNPKELGSGIINYVSEPYMSCLLAAEALAKAAKLGFNITTDVRAKKHIFTVYKGRDLTANQAVNPPCIFSQDFDNVFEQEFINSVENLKTACYVGGEEKEGVTRQIVEISTNSGLERREVFVNASDITQTYKEGDTEITMPLNKYIQMLTQRGEKELMQYAETLNFSSKINAFSNLRYKMDFDIGDIVTCVDRRWGIRINVRITEITESYQQSKNNIDVTFGESLPTLFEKINKMKG